MAADPIAEHALIAKPVAGHEAVIGHPVEINAVDVPGVLPFRDLERQVEASPQMREVYSGR